MLSFVSTERLSWGLPHRLKKGMVSAGTMRRNYHMNMTTAPRPLKTINLPARVPRCQITPRISPLNLNFSGCIKRWLVQSGRERRGSWERRKGLCIGSVDAPHFSKPPPQPETCYNAINLVLEEKIWQLSEFYMKILPPFFFITTSIRGKICAMQAEGDSFENMY